MAMASEERESCIICLISVKAVEAIWSCTQCYCVFHLSCIQAWAQDSLHSLSSGLSARLFPNQTLLWCCPKCRKNHSVVPRSYLCYCGQKVLLYCVNIFNASKLI